MKAKPDRENATQVPRSERSRRGSSHSPGRPNPVATLHRAVGNQAVQSLVKNNSRDRDQPGEATHEADKRPTERVAPERRGQTKHGETEQSPAATGGLCFRCTQRYRAGKPLDCAECETTLHEGLEPTGGQSVIQAAIQPKLAISDPDDEYEHEADRVAERIMGTSASTVSVDTRGTVSTARIRQPCPRCQRRSREDDLLHCKACTEELRRKGSSNESAVVDAASRQQLQLPRDGGRPLPNSIRSFFEIRFGRDFSGVRIHDDERAAEMNTAIGALAFTHGSDLYFGSRHYKPQTQSGQVLLAHELTHVAQQGEAPPATFDLPVEAAPEFIGSQPSSRPPLASDSIQRSPIPEGNGETQGVTPDGDVSIRGVVGRPLIQRLADPANAPPGMSCPIATSSPPPALVDILFNQADASLSRDQKAQIQAFVDGWRNAGASTPVRVDGFASVEGFEQFNWQLSCDRATTVRSELLAPSIGMTLGIPAGQLTHFAQGETDIFDPTTLAPNRRATIYTPAPLPTPEPKCGPDATQWYANQVNTAMTEPDVVDIQRKLTLADGLARSHGTSAQEVAEGGAAAAVIAQETRMRGRAPSRTPAARGQIARGAASGTSAAVSLAMHPTDAALIGGLITDAALKWRRLVNHGAPYDFKAHVMSRPTTPDCPDSGCSNSVTLCPGGASENCYLTDLPGNLFYAQIGRFVGWSQLTLQLGSQLAQLTGTGAWDTPQDTAAIRLGFSLPVPMAASNLCRVLPGARGRINAVTGCDDCPQPFPLFRIVRP